MARRKGIAQRVEANPFLWIGGLFAGLWGLGQLFGGKAGAAAGAVSSTSAVLQTEPGSSTPPVIPAATGPGFQPAGGVLAGSGLPLPVITEAPTRDAYIDQLWAREQVWKPYAREYYNIDNLRRIARAAGAYYGAPPSWVWGLVRGESNFYPVGIYAHSPSKAKAKKSTAYGSGQILRGRFNKSEKAWIDKSTNGYGWNHSDMIDPKRAIWSLAASVGRGLKNRGGGPGRSLAKQQVAIKKMAQEQGGLLVGKWWAGFADKYVPGAKKKIRDVRKYGPDVYSIGKPPSTSMWQKTGPTIPADDLPPWMVGALSASAAQQLGNSNVALEAAGSFLADPDTGTYQAPAPAPAPEPEMTAEEIAALLSPGAWGWEV